MPHENINDDRHIGINIMRFHCKANYGMIMLHISMTLSTYFCYYSKQSEVKKKNRQINRLNLFETFKSSIIFYNICKQFS